MVAYNTLYEMFQRLAQPVYNVFKIQNKIEKHFCNWKTTLKIKCSVDSCTTNLVFVLISE